ncbi:hypothetical protein [Peribacillus sp. R9-11]|uniref:hypothetical protein n=1 Tax=Peribacillus sp. R9-11 TaxID=3073271 RepID=UPI0028692E82|nr:hypothetical protein [Peribacillus sp. R9-11]WMX53899.1 hypothetical protein RE409_17635 [Peribacillus sp. R9-11]
MVSSTVKDVAIITASILPSSAQMSQAFLLLEGYQTWLDYFPHAPTSSSMKNLPRKSTVMPISTLMVSCSKTD